MKLRVWCIKTKIVLYISPLFLVKCFRIRYNTTGKCISINKLKHRCVVNNRILKISMSCVLLAAMYIVMYMYLPQRLSADIKGENDGIAKNSGVTRNDGIAKDDGITKEVQNVDYTSRVVVIDSGHGGFDPGKEGAGGVLEKDINLSIAKKTQRLLVNVGVKVIMTRNEDEGLYDESDVNKKRADMKKRCDIINQSGADVAISIHQNSFGDASVKGAQMFYYKHSVKGKQLAGILQKSFSEYADMANERVEKSDTTYYMLLHTKVPTVIAECGFLSNPGEAALLQDEEYQQKVAYAIYQGILDYFNAM